MHADSKTKEARICGARRDHLLFFSASKRIGVKITVLDGVLHAT
jgi:hypothetical protein